MGSAGAGWVWTPETGRWINPKNQPKETPEAQLEHARQLRLAGNYGKALSEYEKLFRFYPDSDLCPEGQFQVGELYEAKGDYSRASAEYQKVVSNWPASDLFDKVTEKHYEIADRFYQQGTDRTGGIRLFRGRYVRRAIETYQRVIENAPFGRAAARAQYRIAECYFVTGRYLEATYEYQKVLDEYPTSDWAGQATYGLAMCYYRQALPAEYDQTIARKAVEQFRLFARMHPGDPKVADAEAKIGELRADMARQQLVIARFYERIEKTDAARLYYRSAASKYPETEAAREAAETLKDAATSVIEVPPTAAAPSVRQSL
jgi:outer membrane assembly lipoprotein YfiO